MLCQAVRVCADLYWLLHGSSTYEHPANGKNVMTGTMSILLIMVFQVTRTEPRSTQKHFEGGNK